MTRLPRDVYACHPERQELDFEPRAVHDSTGLSFADRRVVVGTVFSNVQSWHSTSDIVDLRATERPEVDGADARDGPRGPCPLVAALVDNDDRLLDYADDCVVEYLNGFQEPG